MRPGPQLVPIQEEDKSVLRNLFELYSYDFSEYTGEDLNTHGRFGYKYIDHYWTEEGRFAYFIKVNDQYAGFALIRTDIEGEFNDKVHGLSEFFILRKYRRQGIGQHVAHQLFDQFPGTWEVTQERENKPSILFWDKIIGAYTQEQFEVREGKEHRVIIFQNKA